MSEAWLLNKTHVRQFLLDTSKKLRPFHTWTEVSGSTLIKLNTAVRAAAVQHIKQLPSKGKTI